MKTLVNFYYYFLIYYYGRNNEYDRLLITKTNEATSFELLQQFTFYH